MPDISLLEGGVTSTAGAVTGTTTSTAVTASGSANTKGTWAQLIASTAHEASWLAVTVRSSAGSAMQFMVDIGVGAAAAEQVIVPNLYLDLVASSATNAQMSVLVPVNVPAGSRLAARCQSTTGSQVALVSVTLVSTTLMAGASLGLVTDYGTTPASTTIASLDPGGVANTKGAYTQLAASTSAPINWLVVMTGHAAGAVTASIDWLADLAVGAAGSEKIIWADQHIRAGSAGKHAVPSVLCFPVSIPASSRLAARCQASVTTATERLLGVAVYGVS